MKPLTFTSTPDGCEEWTSPAGNCIGRLRDIRSEGAGYYASARGWSFDSPSYHKARAALLAVLTGRGWVPFPTE